MWGNTLDCKNRVKIMAKNSRTKKLYSIMVKKISLGLLLSVAMGLMIMYMYDISKFLGFVLGIGCAGTMFMYIATAIEPDEMDEHLNEQEQSYLDELKRKNKGI